MFGTTMSNSRAQKSIKCWMRTILLVSPLISPESILTDDKTQISDANWREGAERVVVRAVDIDFSSIQVDYTITDWERKYFEKNEFTEDQIREIKRYAAYQEVLWDTYANKPEETQFQLVTTENWYEKWSHYKEKLIVVTNKLKLPGEFLRKCIEKVEPNPNDKIALLPVGAYLAANGAERVWILICKWEYAEAHTGADGKKRYPQFSHIRGWAIQETELTRLVFFTCK